MQYLRAIATVHDRHGYQCPSFVEVAEEAGVAYASVHAVVRRLRDRGLVSHDVGTFRSLRLTDAGRALIAEAAQ